MRARYEVLDALRGVAASAVVFYHLHTRGWPFDIIPHGYLAVDFFFMLSGFVMALRYRSPLLDGMGFAAFVALRLKRIYPLAFAGVLLGACVWLCVWFARPGYTDGLPSLLLSFALNVVLLPNFASGPLVGHTLFPENGALWSLSFELVANFIWAAVGVRLTTRTLVIVVVASGALFGLCIVQHGTANLGWGAQNAFAGLARVCFGTTAGLLIYKAHLRIAFPRLPAVAVVASLLLIAIAAAPFNAGPVFPWWDLASVFVGLPAVVMIGIGQGRGGRFGNLLGQISYPLYVVHGPILVATMMATGFGAKGISPAATAAVAVATSYLVAWVALKFYDAKVQAWLSRSRVAAS